uniref:G-protein coupled receptors family 1 profile domain-containing protein n=1 Tax=Setaria digitata TaxID=48799 RepID=A0A915PMN5_9BILA
MNAGVNHIDKTNKPIDKIFGGECSREGIQVFRTGIVYGRYLGCVLFTDDIQDGSCLREEDTIMYSFILDLLLFSGIITLASSSMDNLKWLSPFNNRDKITALCTQDNRGLIMYRSGAPLINRLLHHDVLCRREIQRYIPSRYISLVWFMQSLQYCEINHAVSWQRMGIQYNRTFQLLIMQAAYALVCQQTNDINIYGLMKYAILFRVLFEDNNTDRSIICQRLQNTYNDLFQRCLVDKTNDRLYLLNKMCSGDSMIRLVKMNAFFQRFARNCHTLNDFSINILPKYSSFGEALANDVYFMNLMSNYLVAAVSSESRLLEIVLKTRYLLQLFSKTAIKLQYQLEQAKMCAQQREQQLIILENNDNETNFNYNNNDSKLEKCSYEANFFIHEETSAQIKAIAWFAEIGFYIETFLLLLNFDGSLPASLAITETLNANLFGANKFVNQMIQETLYSLAQNGSLLGLTSLLVLVLVVVNRSMAGKSIRLSRNLIPSDYDVFGGLCDQISPFHNFGVYLLRGHTLFTLTFLVISLMIFVITLCYHRNVFRQNTMLGGETRECKPQRRREILFNTLLLSICAYFVSIAGQTFIEIAIFCAHKRESATEWARWFQLARIAAFVDPLFNPVLVILRIPAMSAKLRYFGRHHTNVSLLLCYCKRAKKKKSKPKRILAQATNARSLNTSRTAYSISHNFFTQLLCSRKMPPKFSSSFRHRGAGPSDNMSHIKSVIKF